MNLNDLQRKMENAGMEPADIDAQIDRLADDLVQHERDENLAKLLDMGYTEDDLEKSNPYNQWLYG